MVKTPIKCYRFFTVVGRVHNIEVYYPFSDFGYANRLFQCRSCRELFAADDEFLGRRGVPEDTVPVDLVCGLDCPTCGSPLPTSLVAYPATFVTPEGIVAHYGPRDSLPGEEEPQWRDVYRLDR